jgi:hypothetical protein
MKAAIIAGAAALFLATGTADAANMRVQRSVVSQGGTWVDNSNNPLLIIIEGDIVRGDYAKFKRIADRMPNGPYGPVVIMTSRGGSLVEGLNIGTTIKAKGFRTFAYDYCMSVCAMMWLAGWQRSTLSETSIGFHGAGYENGEPSIAGNALAGAYLANLGFSYRVIAALIKVGPKEMDWLSFEWAKALGIKVIRGGPCRDVKTNQIVPCIDNQSNSIDTRSSDDQSNSIDTRSRIPETYCPSGQVTEPCR